MEHEYDIVVIGAGPAGCSSAYTASVEGMSVCLIDKRNFPREKLCGGLITTRCYNSIYKIFGEHIPDNIIEKSKKVKFYHNDNLLAEDISQDYLYFTNRFNFDHYLLELVKKTNAKIILGASINHVDFHTKSIYINEDHKISYKYLIACDGVNSYIAKKLLGLSFDSNHIGFGLEVEVPINEYTKEKDCVEIDFGVASWGYGWVFPKSKTITVGVGGIHRLNADLREKLKKFLNFRNLDINNYNVKGQYIPFGKYRKHPVQGNVLFCGDAAGVVDPITGEGIAFAVETGHAAAVAITKSIKSKKLDNFKRLYKYEYNKISKSIKQAVFWRVFIFTKFLQGPFAWAFSDAGTLRTTYFEILSGRHTYDILPWKFIVQTGKALKKGILFIVRSLHKGK